MTALLLLIASALVLNVDAWKVKISNAFGKDYNCSIARVGSTNEWTTTVSGPGVTPFTVASFSQQPMSCTFKFLGDALVTSMLVTGTDNGMLTVRVLNSCNAGDAILTSTVCGVTTLMSAIGAKPTDVLSACGGTGKCGYNSTDYCETYACNSGASCGLYLSFASFSFPITATKQSATCTAGSSPTFGPSTTITAVGTPSVTPTDDALSTCCNARITTSTATAATTTTKPTTTTTVVGSTTTTTGATVSNGASTTTTTMPCSTSCGPSTVFVAPCSCVPVDSTDTTAANSVGGGEGSTTPGDSTTAGAPVDDAGAAQLLMSASVVVFVAALIAH